MSHDSTAVLFFHLVSGNTHILLVKLPATLSLFSKFPSRKCSSFAQFPLPVLMLPLRGQVETKVSTLPSPPTPHITVEVLDLCSLLQGLHEPLQPPLSGGHSVLVCTLLTKKKAANIRWYLGSGWKSNWIVQPLHSSWREHFTVSAHLVCWLYQRWSTSSQPERAAWSQLHPGSRALPACESPRAACGLAG